VVIAAASIDTAALLHISKSVVEELAGRWSRIDIVIDGKRASIEELSQHFQSYAVLVLHTGADVLAMRGDHVELNLSPSTILDDSSLRNSPFFLKVKISTGVISAETDNYSTIPLSVVFGEPITLASWHRLVKNHDQIFRPIGPTTELTIDGDGLTEVRETESKDNIHDHSPELLLRLIESSIEKNVSNRCAVLFSGGIDSTLLLKLIMDSGRDVLAVSVGLRDSHDLALSERVARLIGADRVSVELSQDRLLKEAARIRDALGISSLMDTSLAVLFFTGALEVANNGIRQLIAGQGADELFGGYRKYLRIYQESGMSDVEKVMKQDLAMLWRSGIVRDYSATALAGCLLILPYLDPDIVSFAASLPISLKIKPPQRKIILREACRAAGIPEEVATYEKKAAQYGSGIEKLLKKLYKI
jgi:asparagine synthase (glutamine-hydrolysing)